MEIKSLSEQIQKFQVKGVIDSPLKMGGYMTIATIIFAMVQPNHWLVFGLFTISACIFGVCGFFFLYYGFKSPDLLRSEDHQLRNKALDMYGNKNQQLNLRELNMITNPYYQALPEAEVVEEKKIEQ